VKLAIPFGPDLRAAAGEVIVRGDVSDGAVESHAVVVVDESRPPDIGGPKLL
jgi:hypothetical protein